MSISSETGLKWIAPSAGAPAACSMEQPNFQPAGRTTDGSTVIFAASLPLGNSVMRFHSRMASWLVVLGSLSDPPVGARYSRLMSSVVAPGGNIDVEGVHVDQVAPPRDGFSIGGELEAGDVGDGAGGAVVAGDPLRVDERERAGLYGDGERRADEAARGFGEVGADGHRLGGDGRLCGR